jgi:hypothetical protein
MNNPLKNTRIEFHILQSFPVSCSGLIKMDTLLGG